MVNEKVNNEEWKYFWSMGHQTLFDILRDIVFNLTLTQSGFPPLPADIESPISLSEQGFDSESIDLILNELKNRLDGKDVNIVTKVGIEKVLAMPIKEFLMALQESILTAVRTPIVVYVDDEEENIFVFKRYFGKNLRLETFTDPEEAFDFIRKESNVRLVITDESMPRLTGTALCNAIRRYKPFLKFILLTGNPNNDGDLMYNALKHGKFHDFINKPIDLQNRGQEYLLMMQGLISGELIES